MQRSLQASMILVNAQCFSHVFHSRQGRLRTLAGNIQDHLSEHSQHDHSWNCTDLPFKQWVNKTSYQYSVYRRCVLLKVTNPTRNSVRTCDVWYVSSMFTSSFTIKKMGICFEAILWGRHFYLNCWTLSHLFPAVALSQFQHNKLVHQSACFLVDSRYAPVPRSAPVACQTLAWKQLFYLSCSPVATSLRCALNFTPPP